MRKMKFYGDDRDGGLECVVVKIWDGGVQAQGKVKTRAWVEAKLARLGLRKRSALPPALRDRIPIGGMSANREVAW